MEQWLKTNFETFVDEDGYENIEWATDRDTIMYARINSIIDKFGEEDPDKNKMYDEASEGWKAIIDRWHELGKFN